MLVPTAMKVILHGYLLTSELGTVGHMLSNIFVNCQS